MAHIWDSAEVRGKRATQAYELFGNRTIYHDGWIASMTPPVLPGGRSQRD